MTQRGMKSNHKIEEEKKKKNQLTAVSPVFSLGGAASEPSFAPSSSVVLAMPESEPVRGCIIQYFDLLEK